MVSFPILKQSYCRPENQKVWPLSEFALKYNIFFFYFKSCIKTAIGLFNQMQQMYQELMCKFVSPDALLIGTIQ